MRSKLTLVLHQYNIIREPFYNDPVHDRGWEQGVFTIGAEILVVDRIHHFLVEVVGVWCAIYCKPIFGF